MKILVVEDDVLNRKLVKKILEKENYSVLESNNGKLALDIIKNEDPDLVILDLMLPDSSGIKICEKIKKHPKIYGNPMILMLTAKTGSNSVVEGFDVGADDYLKKPFEKKEFLPRIKALLRRARQEDITIYKYGNIILNIDSMTVEISKATIELSKTEFKLLEYLILNKGIVLSREKILENVWEEYYDLDINIVNVYIKKLRDKIPELKEKLNSVRGFGYTLNSK